MSVRSIEKFVDPCGATRFIQKAARALRDLIMQRRWSHWHPISTAAYNGDLELRVVDGSRAAETLLPFLVVKKLPRPRGCAAGSGSPVWKSARASVSRRSTSVVAPTQSRPQSPALIGRFLGFVTVAAIAEAPIGPLARASFGKCVVASSATIASSSLTQGESSSKNRNTWLRRSCFRTTTFSCASMP